MSVSHADEWVEWRSTAAQVGGRYCHRSMGSGVRSRENIPEIGDSENVVPQAAPAVAGATSDEVPAGNTPWLDDLGYLKNRVV